MEKTDEFKDKDAETTSEQEDATKTSENEKTEENATTENDAEKSNDFSTEFSLTFKEKFNALYEAVASMNVSTNTECVFYDLADFDDKYCYIYQAYFSQEKPSGEFTKGRVSYSESDNKIVLDANSYQEMFVKWLTLAEVNVIEQLKGDYAKLEEKVKEFEKKELQAQLQAVANEFTDLHEDEEFKVILEKANDYTVEAFQEKLFALRGKKLSFSKKQEKQEVKIPFGIETTKDAPYGGIVETYTNKN